ncbi:MAG: ATP-binding protein [Pseudomonadota bacterium]
MTRAGSVEDEPQRASSLPKVSDRQLLDAFVQPVLAVGPANQIIMANYAAQQFFLRSEKTLLGQPLNMLVGNKAELTQLVGRARSIRSSLSGYDISLQFHPDRAAQVDVQACVILEQPDCVLIALERRAMADQISQQHATQKAARAASGAASMLAHEVKNPLSGIRGAAQLIEDSLPPEEAALSQLIVKETDRIAALVEQMEVFSDDRPVRHTRENIHHILDHVIAVAKSSVGDVVSISAKYDPSLPDIEANWSQLVQVYLNLILNAAEAAPPESGYVQVKTAFRHGTRMRMQSREEQVPLPIEVAVIDNGPGVPEALQQSLFDPFVSGKKNGKGLGLALAAKIITDHNGFIGYQRVDGRTQFRTMLPPWTDGSAL